MIRYYNPFLCLVFINFPQHYQATVASRQTETEAESIARHARNSQGFYMLDVFAYVENFYLIFLSVTLAATARRDTETEVETQARRARDSPGTYMLFKFPYIQTYCIYYNTLC